MRCFWFVYESITQTSKTPFQTTQNPAKLPKLYEPYIYVPSLKPKKIEKRNHPDESFRIKNNQFTNNPQQRKN
jgi:hypothetical protein